MQAGSTCALRGGAPSSVPCGAARALAASSHVLPLMECPQHCLAQERVAAMAAGSSALMPMPMPMPTQHIGPDLKVLILILLPLPLVAWPFCVAIGAIAFTLAVGFFWPIGATVGHNDLCSPKLLDGEDIRKPITTAWVRVGACCATC